MSDSDKPNRKKATTDTSMYLRYIQNKENEMARPVRQQSVTAAHGAFFTPQRPRHSDSFVEPRRNYGLPSLSSAESS